MGLNRSRFFMSLLLAAALGAGVVACDDEEAEAEEPTEEAQESEESADIDTDSLPFYATGPVARIDGEEIGQAQFNELVAERVERLPGELPPQMVDMFKGQTIDFVIDKHLVDSVLDDQDIEVTDEDIDKAFNEFKERFGGDEAAFQQQLEQMGMTEAEIRENMHQDVELEKYLATQHDLEVSDEEIRAFFDQNEQQFATEDQVRARHVLIKADADADDETDAQALQRATEIYEQATGDADFEALAREHSEGPTAAQGGDLGFFPKHQMVPEFSEVAFSMEAGEISEPVRSDFGYHVIQLVETQEGGEPDFEEVKDEIAMQLTHQKRQEAFHAFLEELKAGTEIEKLEDNIAMNVEAPSGQQGMPAMPHGHDHDRAPQPQQGQPPQGPQGQELQLEAPDLGGE